ncbi:putative F-box protein At3g16210 [Bidens hawaiensis]|uniref:putative F-box protein At3g16210 n=1 Tax=Bidens hawaiensis TaxID=980011 RepID=UPI00404B0BFD
MTCLPEDIVFNILVRLQTKPLVRFRCLSKHWNRLISDYFMKSRSRRMILLPFQSLLAIRHTLPWDKTVHYVSTSRIPSPFNYLGTEDHVQVVGAFDGIVVLLCKDILMLFNPLTGSFKIVPHPPLDSSNRVDTYGLCYGETLDDLKIVKLRLRVRYPYRVSCDVFSLKKGLWSTKSIKLDERYIVDRLLKERFGIFANGYLYWIALKKPDGMYVTIALDVKEMVLSEIPLPCKFSSRDSLCTLSGRLHFFHKSNMTYELWVMNEDGMEKSCSKVLTSNINLSNFSILFSNIDTGKIIMIDNKDGLQIKIYDMLKESYDAYNLHWIVGSLQGSQAMEYVESLISPSYLYSTW